jgi:hypothetical protein
MAAYDGKTELSLGFNFNDSDGYTDPYTLLPVVGARDDDFADAESNADDYEDTRVSTYTWAFLHMAQLFVS